MRDVFVMDACSLIAFLADEPGASLVEDILHKARRNECLIYVNYPPLTASQYSGSLSLVDQLAC